MNEQPLHEMIRKVVKRARSESKSEDQLVAEVLADPDVALLMNSIEAHDRSGDLDDVYMGDIRRKVEKYLREA